MESPLQTIQEQFGPQLSGLICKKVKHQDYCHDILQDVYVKIANNVDKVERADNILSYILKLASNAVMDYYRSPISKVTVAGALNELPNSDGETNDATSALAHSFLIEMINSLPAIYSEALNKVELQGITQKQLARELGISYSGVKSRVQRAKEMLRQAIVSCCNYKFDRYGNVISCCGSECC